MANFMICGTKSGSGKTTISTAIMALLNDVQPFKVGPDYIDPSFHKFVTGNNSYNLDLFMVKENSLKYLFNEHGKNHKHIVVEGVMGLYDGYDDELDNFSSAHISRVLNLPIILVVDGKSVATSIAATVLGFKTLDPNINIAGVIINNCSSEKLYKMHKKSIKKYTDIDCLGYFPYNNDLSIGSRALGLLQADEVVDLKEKIKILKDYALKYLDIEKIKNIGSFKYENYRDPAKNLINKFKGLKVGIAMDRAFSFYYKDNLELMEKSGMELIPFSPINDKKIPEVDFLYFGGGYPEIFAHELSDNLSMIDSIKSFYENNGKIYGECGGFIYLSNRLKTVDEKEHQFCNLLNIDILMQNRLNIMRFGYIDIENINVKAHEFHYSKIENCNENEGYFDIHKKNRDRKWNCGYKKNNLLAGYPHIHFYSNLDFFIELFS